MSLRARIGAAAGVAVAVAVVAVAVSAYAGTRSNLLGGVDQSLRSLAGQVLTTPSLGQSGPAPPSSVQPSGGAPTERGRGAPAEPGSVSPTFGGGGSPRRGGAAPSAGGAGAAPPLFRPTGSRDCDRGFGLDQRSASLGGAAGLFELVTPRGASCLAHNQTTKIPVDGPIRAVARSGLGKFFIDTHIGSTQERVLVQGVGPHGALVVAEPLTGVDRTLHDQLLLLLGIGAAGIVLAAGLGILVARTALTPIARFTQRTEVVAGSADPSQRLEVSGDDELARLARTFNATLDALGRSVESQRNLVADASHELRTPIASLRANLQLLRDEAQLPQADRDALREDMISELDELTGLVGDVVELARGVKTTTESGDVRLDLVVADLIDRAGRRAPTLTFHASLQPTLVYGEGDRIGRAVANLLDNARKWSSPDGAVEVELRDGTLTVRDHGPGFNEHELAYVFDRFHRAKEARGKPGSGLGLAIVRQAAEAHGGSAEAANAQGGGAVLRVSFGSPLPLEDLESSSATPSEASPDAEVPAVHRRRVAVASRGRRRGS